MSKTFTGYLLNQFKSQIHGFQRILLDGTIIFRGTYCYHVTCWKRSTSKLKTANTLLITLFIFEHKLIIGLCFCKLLDITSSS